MADSSLITVTTDDTGLPCKLIVNQAGLRVVRILEAASESLKQRGIPVEIERGKTAAWSHS